MRNRRRILVYARRGDNPAYSYEVFASVKAGKAVELAHETAIDILSHETRSGAYGSLTRVGTGAIVSINHGQCKFVVRVL